MVKAKKRISPRTARTLIAVLVFAVGGTVLLSLSDAAPGDGLRAAESPRHALGVSGTPSATFARWLDRDDVNKDIRFGLTLAHFSPSSIETNIRNAAQSSQEKTTVVTINPVPDGNFLPDRSKDPNVCGTYGSSSNGLQNDYRNLSSTFNYNGNRIQLANTNMGNAKQDKNGNDINDNIENLYRAAEGCYDLTYQHIADSILRYNAHEFWPDGRPKLVIRMGHEHNGGHFEWSSNNQTDSNQNKALQLTGGRNGNQLYKETWQRMIGLIEDRVEASVPGAEVYFEFNTTYVALTSNTNYHNQTYPGNEYVDVLGLSFYDRQYPFPWNQNNAECFEFDGSDYVVPDCWSNSVRENALTLYGRALDNLEAFADSKGKLVGLSEHTIAAKLDDRDGKDYWIEGGDNPAFIEQNFQWAQEQADEERLAYYFIWDRNGVGSIKNPNFDMLEYKSIHKMTPGISNHYSMPSNNTNTTCALEWSFSPKDADGNPTSGSNQVHRSLFPKSAEKFLELWAGPIEGGPATHPNCPTGSGGNTNSSPQVDVGGDRNAVVNTPLSLSATVSDDGRPNPPGQLTYTWSRVSGPGSVTFTDSAAQNTNATFDTVGTYVVQLRVSDSELDRTDSLTITVTEPGAGGGDQFVLVNESVTHDGSGGFPAVQDLSSIPDNWQSPINYVDGRTYARFEVVDLPANHGLQLDMKICLFRDGFNEQTCSDTIPFEDTGVIWAEIGSPANWWKRNNTWDFTTAPESMRIQFTDTQTGKNILVVSCGTTCSTQAVVDSVTPMTVNVQAVVVAQGSNISPLPSWTNCPIDFGCQSGSDDVMPTLPPVGVVNFDSDVIELDTGAIAASSAELRDINGTVIDTDPSEPFELRWRSESSSNGNFTALVRVYDAGGQTYDSTQFTVKIRYPDINRSGTVDIADLSQLLANWGNADDPQHDLSDNGRVDIVDLSIILSRWGT